MKQKKVECGNANPNGNVYMRYKGGCGEELNMEDAYRCTGCGGWFHLECIFKHFELEKDHDISRYALKRIKTYVKTYKKRSKNEKIIELCEHGLKRNKQLK